MGKCKVEKLPQTALLSKTREVQIEDVKWGRRGIEVSMSFNDEFSNCHHSIT